MKPIFHAEPINPPFGDPLVYVRIRHESRALLFDCGDLSLLAPGHIMDITDVFVTHMHIDHFIGFDTIIRTILHRETPIRFYGPAGIADCISGKLQGYTWNLIRDYPLVIKVYEVADGMISRSRFAAPEAFSRVNGQQSPFEGVLLDEPLMTVSALPLMHGVPSLGYRLHESFHINIHKTALEELGIEVGPWLAQLKTAIRETAKTEACTPDEAIGIVARSGNSFNGHALSEHDVRKFVQITKGQSIAYIMDTAPTPDNISAITGFVRNVDDLFCEAYFLEEDADRARERHHLTAASAGRIGRSAGTGTITALHFSPRYRDCPERVYDEINAFYR